MKIPEFLHNYGWKLTAMFWTCGCVFAQAQPSKTAQKLTGCLDERPGPRYVLREERQLQVRAELSPDGFPVQNFARYLGHKVEVSGTLATAAAGDTPRMQVRSIRSIADTCASGEGQVPAETPHPFAPGTPSPVPPKKTATGSHTVTGCVDEAPGPQYVLRSPGDMNLMFQLEADGFDVQSFAKHLGHKVRLTGSTSAQGGKPVMKVRTIEDTSPTCTPDQ